MKKSKLLDLIFKTSIAKQDKLIKQKTIKLSKALKSLEDLENATLKQKNKIYEEIKTRKKKNNELLEVKGTNLTINISGNKGKLYDRLKDRIFSIVGKKKNLVEYKMLYFGNGNIASLIDLPRIDGTIINNDDKKELHIFDLNKDTEVDEKPYFIGGKRLIFLNKDTIFNPQFDTKNNKFIFDIKPNYFFAMINYVMDWALTRPKGEKTDLIGVIKKYWIIIALAIGLYILQNGAE